MPSDDISGRSPEIWSLICSDRVSAKFSNHLHCCSFAKFYFQIPSKQPLNFPGILSLQFSLTSSKIITYEQYRKLFVGTFITSTQQLCLGAIILLFPVHAFGDIPLCNYIIESDSIQSIKFNSTIKNVSVSYDVGNNHGIMLSRNCEPMLSSTTGSWKCFLNILTGKKTYAWPKILGDTVY